MQLLKRGGKKKEARASSPPRGPHGHWRGCANKTAGEGAAHARQPPPVRLRHRLLHSRDLIGHVPYVTHWYVASFESQQISLLILSLLMSERREQLPHSWKWKWIRSSVDQWWLEGARSHGGAEARRKQREESTTGHKAQLARGNWCVSCSCLCVETPAVSHRRFALPRSSIL
jgi:hypothetical protein